MAELDTTYRTPRHRTGMDPNTRKLALIAVSIGAVLVVMVGAWSLTGGKSGAVPVVEADSRPLRVKPDKTQQDPDIDEPTTPGKQALAPTPEAPKPEALKAQADKAAAEKAATEKLAADKAAADKAQAEAARLAAAPSPVVVPPAVVTHATGPTRPQAQPVALTAPVVPAPAVQQPPAQAARPATPPVARPAATAAPQPVVAAGTQVQLAAVTSEQAALSEWSRLEKRMPDILGSRRPAVVKAERDGKTFWRLRTGGFTDTIQASSFCDQVRAKGGTCSVASF